MMNNQEITNIFKVLVKEVIEFIEPSRIEHQNICDRLFPDNSSLTAEEIEVINLSSQLFEKALRLYKISQDKEWGIVDCISFIVMREAGIEQALTFDKHFRQAGFRIFTAN